MFNYNETKDYAKLGPSLKLLFGLEHNNDPRKALHSNLGEHGLTYKGIYEAANPHWVGWSYIKTALSLGGSIPDVSAYLEGVNELQVEVHEIYRKKYWDRARLSYVESQRIADEIFIFGVNVGMRNAIRKAQKLVGVKADGVVGNKTLAALNRYDVDTFDMAFDALEKDYYEDIIEDKPYLAKYENGWNNRADAV